MEPTPYDLTPEQKGLLESLSRQTGKAIPALIDEALEGLRHEVRPEPANGNGNGGSEEAPAVRPEAPHKPIWEKIQDAFANVPEEELESLPVDGAAQVDHYAYGLPKR